MIKDSHLAPLASIGPFSAIDEACRCGPAAALRSGWLIGWNGMWDGCCPEKIRFANGVPYGDPERLSLKGHYALPWLSALSGDKLASAIIDHVRSILRVDANGPLIGHKGTGLGWPGRQQGQEGLFCHNQHPENALYLWKWTGDTMARDWWQLWLTTAKAALIDNPNVILKENKSGQWHHRNTHCAFVSVWLAWLWTSDDFWRVWALKLARILVGKPLAQHEQGWFDPLWTYYAWQCLGKEAEPWLLEADDQCWQWTETVPLALAATAYWIDGNADRLRRHLQTLADFPGRYFDNDPHNRHSWLGVGIGPEDGSIPNAWPLFKRALTDAGITALPQPSVGYYPISLRWPAPHNDVGGIKIVVGLSGNLAKGSIRCRSYGGDAPAVNLTVGDQQRQRVTGSGWQYTAPYAFAKPVGQIRIQPEGGWGQIAAPISNSPDEHAELLPGCKYFLAGCRAFLWTTGPVTFECVNEHVTFRDAAGKVTRGLFSGRDGEYVVKPSAPSAMLPRQGMYLDIRGVPYSKVMMTCSASAEFWPARL